MIAKSFKIPAKYIILLVVTGCVSMIIFSGCIGFHDISRITEVITAEDTYGEYYFSVYGVEDDYLDVFDKKDIKKCVVDLYFTLLDDKTSVMYGISEPDLKYTEYKLAEGVYPGNAYEMLIEKWYAVQNNISIGDEVIFNNGEKDEAWKVTGYINNMSSFGSAEGESAAPVIVIDPVKNQELVDTTVNNIYLECNDIDLIWEELPDMCMESNAQGFSYNTELIKAVEALDNAEINKIFQNPLYGGLAIVLVIYSVTTFNAVADILFSYWNKSAYILRAIGAGPARVRRAMLNRILSCVLISSVTGTLIGYGGVYIINGKIHALGDFWGQKYIFRSWAVIGILLVTIMVLTYAALRHKTNIIAGLSPCELKNVTGLSYMQSVNRKKRNSIFKKQGDLFDLAIRNLSFYKWRKAAVALMICVSVMIVSISGYMILPQTKYNLNNLKYDYHFTVKDYYKATELNQPENIKKIYNAVIDYCRKNSIDVYYDAGQEIEEFKLNKSWLTDNYKKYIEENANSAGLNDPRKTILTTAVVYGYTDEMFRRLISENNLNIRVPAEGEVIVCSKIFNKDNKKAYDLNVMTGEVIKCTSPVINGPDSTNPGERKIYTGTVVGAIEEPLLDMDDDSRTEVCLIVPMEDFRNYFLYDDYVCDFYIDSLTGRQFSDITQIVAGTNYIKIENQHDLYEAVSVHRHKTILVYAIVCIMGCVLLVLNVIMIVYNESYVRRKEFQTLHKLGMTHSKIRRMIVYELLIICGAGLISGVGISMCVLSVILRNFS